MEKPKIEWDYGISSLQRKRTKRVAIFFMIFLLVTALLVLYKDYQVYKQKQLNEASTQLLLFSLDELKYCTSKLNVTLEEFNKDFLINKSIEIINNKTMKGGKDEK